MSTVSMTHDQLARLCRYVLDRHAELQLEDAHSTALSHLDDLYDVVQRAKDGDAVCLARAASIEAGILANPAGRARLESV